MFFKCKMCGGTLEFEQGSTIGVCDYCGIKQTLPRLDDDRRKNLYDRANHFRRNNDFDKAMGIYEQILNEDTTDAEAYWSIVLCRYGIEYVEDPATHKRIPTINRTQFYSVLADEDYKAAIEHASAYQKPIYEEEARVIDDIQKGILSIAQKEESFDIFICYKETDENGRRTPDSVLANDLYHQLVQEGFKVFFSRITLEDKLGIAYEPYIFAALNSSKVMIAMGTKPEYFNSVWVRNEWSRYLTLIKHGAKKNLIPAYRDMDPYDLPEEFSHLQALDMSKLGFVQDLIRGIKKLVPVDLMNPTQKEESVAIAGPGTAPLLERAFLFLEDGRWEDANDYCEKVLDFEPRNPEAYLGKLMAEIHVKHRKQLIHANESFEKSDNYKKAIRFGDENLKKELNDCINQINERNEQARIARIYNDAKRVMSSTETEEAYINAAKTLESISGYKDADALAEECLEKAENCRKEQNYELALSAMNLSTIEEYQRATEILKSISGWRDADDLIVLCQKQIEIIKEKQETERIAAIKRDEEKRKATEKKAKQKKIVISAAVLCLCVLVIGVIVDKKVIIPDSKYNDAMKLKNQGNYSEALVAFEKMNGYKDSERQVVECQEAIDDLAYNRALRLKNEGKYKEAIQAFEVLNGYRDSLNQITICQTAILDSNYDTATNLKNNGNYEEAIILFETLDGYKDSAKQISYCQTAIKDLTYDEAVSLKDSGKYEEAVATFKKLKGYKDSNELAQEASFLFEVKGIKEASVGDIVIFGDYEQDNLLDNGKEKIEWIVLEKNEEKVLLISRCVIDCIQYNQSRADVTWETCYLREWLNNTFIHEAFTTKEQSIIQPTKVSADKNPNFKTNPGKSTEDMIFVLSISEALHFFPTDESRKCTPTTYAEAHGTLTSDFYTTNSGQKTCWWWLRSPGKEKNEAANIFRDGLVDYEGDSVNHINDGVRPVMWVNIHEQDL